MPLTEAEELELLELEAAEAAANFDPARLEAAKRPSLGTVAKEAVVGPPRRALQFSQDPVAQAQSLPTVATAAALPFGPAATTIAGGLGSIGRDLALTAFDQPDAPQTGDEAAMRAVFSSVLGRLASSSPGAARGVGRAASAVGKAGKAVVNIPRAVGAKSVESVRGPLVKALKKVDAEDVEPIFLDKPQLLDFSKALKRDIQKGLNITPRRLQEFRTTAQELLPTLKKGTPLRATVSEVKDLATKELARIAPEVGKQLGAFGEASRAAAAREAIIKAVPFFGPIRRAGQALREIPR